jgi:hypothetical protein
VAQGHYRLRTLHRPARVQNRGKGMLFASKIACSGILFLLMTPWISGPRPTPVDSGTNLNSNLPAETPGSDVKEMQQTLRHEGRYRGKVDGVFGLRARASIREFQKAKSLPVTGQLDARTAGKLGVRPEARRETGYQATQDKPSAGIKWTRGSRRSSQPLQRPMKKSPTVPPA